MKVIFTGGGTGGHVYPALALIDEWKNRFNDFEAIYIGSENGIEKKLANEKKLKYYTLDVQGLKRRISFSNIVTIFKYLKAKSKVKKIIKNEKPDLVFGTGGYVCAPVIMASSKLGVKTIIHEQNSFPGMANRKASKNVDKILTCFEEASKYFPVEKTVLVGNPRASQILNSKDEKIEDINFGSGDKVVLILGGSGGAKKINDMVLKMIKDYVFAEYKILFVTGEKYYDYVMSNISEEDVQSNVYIYPYIKNLVNILHKIDLIVSRSGATTISEITALGIPSILIPSPNVTNNHQYHNAKSLFESGGAVLISEEDLTEENLYENINNIISNEFKITEMRRISKKFGYPNAIDDITNIVENLLGN